MRRKMGLWVAGMAAVVMASTAPMSAGAAIGGKIGYLGGDRAFTTVCRDWGATTCKGPQAVLYPGQWSHTRYGWTDTDGYWVPKGCSALTADNIVLARGGSKGLWKKTVDTYKGQHKIKCP